ncbi:FAD-binding domain-containing protein [Atractiella rhizophila]|nr:FAD-binding domain-containing protein [Atractiella rhizophila]
MLSLIPLLYLLPKATLASDAHAQKPFFAGSEEGIDASFRIARAGDHGACSYGEECWPSKPEWEALDASLSGRIIESLPPARFCHGDIYDEEKCAEAKANWDVSEWKTVQAGGYPGGADYGYGDDLCTPHTPKEAPCKLGKIPPLMAEVASAEDVIKSLAFASKHNLNVRVKSTGHSLYGASAGKGAFGISVHKLKDIRFEDDFQLAGSLKKVGPAVVMGAGVQFMELYEAADKAGRVVLGGGCDSVGVAGFTLGGGHSRISPIYGLGVDQVLQFNIVTPNGLYLTVNEITHPDLWWAIRGGGGGFGVLTEIVYKTHPAFENEVINNFVMIARDEETWEGLMKAFMGIQPTIRDAGWSDVVLAMKMQYTMVGAAFKPNVSSIEDEEALFAPVQAYAAQHNVTVLNNFTAYHSFYELTVSEPFANQHSFPLSSLSPLSRLVPRQIYENTTSLDLLASYFAKNVPYFTMIDVAGGAVSKNPHSSALNPAWRSAIAHFLWFSNWQDGDSYEDQAKARAIGDASLRGLSDLLNLDASYVNEASPDDALWPKSWWGDNYARLLEVKNAYDPQHLLKCIGCVGSPARA